MTRLLRIFSVILFTLPLVSFVACGNKGTDPRPINPEINSPTFLQAIAESGYEIELSWIDNSNNEDGFVVERANVSGGDFVEVGRTSQDEDSFIDTGLVPLTTYFYVVRGYNSGGYSNPTNEAQATTLEGNAPGDKGVAVARVELEFEAPILAGVDEIAVGEGEMKMIHKSGAKPGNPKVRVCKVNGSECTSIYAGPDYRVWDFAWREDIENETYPFDMQLSGLLTDEFGRLANLKKISGLGSAELNDDKIAIDLKNVLLDDGPDFKISFEYWYMESGGTMPDTADIGVARVTIQVSIDGKDTFVVGENQMGITHNRADKPGNPRVWIDKFLGGDSWESVLPPPGYDTWEVSWSGNQSNFYSLQLDDFVAGEFYRVSNLKKLAGGGDDGDSFALGDNKVIIDDGSDGRDTYKFSFEYWYVSFLE